MLIIRSFFYVTIPSNEEYAINTNDYYLGHDGNILTDTDRTDVYEYGDIIIQTSRVKYIFKRVYFAYDYAVRIMEYIIGIKSCQDRQKCNLHSMQKLTHWPQ